MSTLIFVFCGQITICLFLIPDPFSCLLCVFRCRHYENGRPEDPVQEHDLSSGGHQDLHHRPAKQVRGGSTVGQREPSHPLPPSHRDRHETRATRVWRQGKSIVSTVMEALLGDCFLIGANSCRLLTQWRFGSSGVGSFVSHTEEGNFRKLFENQHGFYEMKALIYQSITCDFLLGVGCQIVNSMYGYIRTKVWRG